MHHREVTKAWHPEQRAFETRLLAAAKAKKLALTRKTLRPCIAIATKPKTKRSIGSSRIGGLPDLPPKHAWPMRDGEPMLFVAQLRLDELAPYDPESLFPPQGVLSFFVADFGDPHVMFFEDPAKLVEQQPPSTMKFGGLKWKAYEAAALELEGEVSAPNNESGWLVRRTAKRERFVHRVLGHDFGDTDPPFEEAAVLLLALGTDDALDMNWGDAGRIYFVVDRAALARRDFAKVTLRHTL
jgi:uncharacterized protein YwqG